MAASGVRARLTSWSLWASIFSPRNAISGSTITSFAPTRPISRSRSGRSFGSAKGRSCLDSPIPVTTVFKEEIREVSAPAASRRGLMVSARPSSAESTTTPPASHCAPSGKGLPAETLAARSSTPALLPSPGSPSMTEIFPRASQPRHSQDTRSLSTSEMRIPPNVGRASDPSRSEPPPEPNNSERASCSAARSACPLVSKPALPRPEARTRRAAFGLAAHVRFEAAPVYPDRAAHLAVLDLPRADELPDRRPGQPDETLSLLVSKPAPDYLRLHSSSLSLAGATACVHCRQGVACL